METRTRLNNSGFSALGTAIAILMFLGVVSSHRIQSSPLSPSDRTRLSQAHNTLPWSFEANQGQFDAHVKFLVRGQGYRVLMTSTEAQVVLSRTKSSPTVFRMQLPGSNPLAELTGINELPGKTNYFLGNDPAKWQVNVSTYSKVRYRGVYLGIDLYYYGNGRQLEYDFVVAPGADPDVIRLNFEGSERVRIAPEGDLVVESEDQEIRMLRPFVYQEVMGTRHAIPAKYVLLAGGQVGFEVAAYDVHIDLIIDPILSYSTYLGGTAEEFNPHIAVDASGNVYLTGVVGSTDFPMTNPLQPESAGGRDVFVTKLNADGSALVYSTYLGGSGEDHGTGIAVDASGHAYIAGHTHSTDFPTANPLQPMNNGSADAFVSKLNATGSALVYSTYLGGNSGDFDTSIAIDGSGNVYITGITDSTNFPTANPLQSDTPGLDVFVSKLNATGSMLIYSTYLGGSGQDNGNGIAVDAVGNAYVIGNTFSTDFPTANALQPGNGGDSDAFVSKLNASGSALVYSTYVGGDDRDYGSGITIDNSGNAYVTGNTSSANFPTANPLQPFNAGTSDNFVSKLNPAGSALVYSTYLGGSNWENASRIAIDAAGNAYVAGDTLSTNFPTVNPLPQGNSGANEVFVSMFNAEGTGLVYSTYLGGNNADYRTSIAVDASDNAYITGNTYSTNFQTANPLQPTIASANDIFVAKIRHEQKRRGQLVSQ